MMEFILILPIYLLLIGGSMLIFEIHMARLHLQESNRNLSWTVGDRFFSIDDKTRLLAELESYFTQRNKLDNVVAKNSIPLYGFGESSEELWGIGIDRKEISGQSPFLGSTDWGTLAAGNMPVKMNRVSGAYIGPLGAGDTLYPDEKLPLAEHSFSLTRTKEIFYADDADNGNYMPEAYLYKRGKQRLNRGDNEYMKNLFGIALDKWPGPEDMDVQSSQTVDITTDRYNRRLHMYAQ